MGCIFCDIISGKQKSKKLYEDGEFLAILDAFPVTEGHALVIPKQHAKNVYELSGGTAANAFLLARRMARALQDALRADDVNIATAPAAIDHFHMHVVPRYDADLMGPLADLGNKREMPEKAMEEIAGKVRAVLARQQPAATKQHEEEKEPKQQ